LARKVTGPEGKPIPAANIHSCETSVPPEIAEEVLLLFRRRGNADNYPIERSPMPRSKPVMTYEEVAIITPLSRKVKVRLEKKGDDVWDTTIVFGRQTHRVGKFQGRDRAMEASRKKAIEVANLFSADPATLDEDDRRRAGKYKKRKSVP
jgi:hypothetical protein